MGMRTNYGKNLKSTGYIIIEGAASSTGPLLIHSPGSWACYQESVVGVCRHTADTFLGLHFPLGQKSSICVRDLGAGRGLPRDPQGHKGKLRQRKMERLSQGLPNLHKKKSKTKLNPFSLCLMGCQLQQL